MKMNDLTTILENFRMEVNTELQNNILPFWMTRMKDPEGGFLGRIDGLGNPDPDSPKGAILNARILWTFASAYRLYGNPEYLETALRARDEVIDRFYDEENGGIYWSLDPEGNPLDTKKQIYANGFAIYGLAELNRASGDAKSLEYAIKIYEAIEKYSFDTDNNGYFEAFTKDWGPIADMRLSEKEQNVRKTMNTHLHIIEPYTCLYRVWKDKGLEKQIRNLIDIFLDKILLEDGHLGLFFADDWTCTSETISYGHDIEAVWLLCEAAEVIGDEALTARVRSAAYRIAQAALEGYTRDGGMIYELVLPTGEKDADRHWWVQAETVVGNFNEWQITGEERFLENALATWEFIKKYIICPDGEWYWSRKVDGTANTSDDRAGFWKCPYHSGRMCMEIAERAESLIKR